MTRMSAEAPSGRSGAAALDFLEAAAVAAKDEARRRGGFCCCCGRGGRIPIGLRPSDDDRVGFLIAVVCSSAGVHALACGALTLAKTAIAAPLRREGPRAGLRGVGSGDAAKGIWFLLKKKVKSSQASISSKEFPEVALAHGARAVPDFFFEQHSAQEGCEFLVPESPERSEWLVSSRWKKKKLRKSKKRNIATSPPKHTNRPSPRSPRPAGARSWPPRASGEKEEQEKRVSDRQRILPQRRAIS